MTWSSNAPRGTRREPASRDAAPVAWDELALDTRGLHEVFSRTPIEPVPDALEEPMVDPEALEQALQEAYARGVEDGRRAGELAEATRLRGATRAVAEALASTQVNADRWVGNAEENICALAVAVARQVIGREIAVDKSSLADMVQQALAEFPMDQALTLRVNPSDLQTIQSSFFALGEASPLSARKDVQWLPDGRVAPGGCLIEGRDRIVDGRVDTALERLYRRLTYTGA
ncbi:MAG TPA: FliH/SctL family protein [Gemmatimonadaceae bacterium]|nr:FliH/SctL family protein [Gemmatimonadaceae bacterium]